MYEDLDAVSVSCTRDAKGDLHISFVNLDPNTSHSVEVSLGEDYSVVTSARVLTAETMQGHNTFEMPDEVIPHSLLAVVAGGVLKLDLPAKSVAVVSLAV